MSVGTRQKVRVFLEGREVPFISASVTCTVGQPAQANVELVPLQGIKFIQPRTQIQIFVKDPKNFGTHEFYLMFDGEVVGKARSKKQDSRTFTVSALDYSSYWEDSKLYMMNPAFTLGMVEQTASLKQPPIDQVTKALAGEVVKMSATANMRIIEIIMKGGKTAGKEGVDIVKGCAELIKELGPSNLFLKMAYERLRVIDRLNVYTGDKVADFLKDLSLEEFLHSLGGMHGGMSSINEMIKSVMGLVFHQFISVAFPAKINKPTGTAMTNFMFVPEGYTLPPPMCNVVFPNQQIGYEFSENMRVLPTRYMFRASLPMLGKDGPNVVTTNSQFYPTSFSDFMFGKHTADEAEKNSLLGASTLIKDPKTGKSYADIFYGKPSSEKIGTAAGTILRTADFLTNEESIKGIYLDIDAFIPSFTALTLKSSAEAQSAFLEEVGHYQFFKKRYEHKPVAAELIFNPFLVPGFNILFLDDSTAGQSFMASLNSVTHHLSNSGCATIVSLSHGRDFDETDLLTGGQGEPPLPGWFDNEVFGDVDEIAFSNETTYLKKIGALHPTRDAAEIAARAKMEGATTFINLSKFYQSLLGVNAITNYNKVTTAIGKTAPKPQIATPRGAVYYLLNIYRNLSNDPVARDKKVIELTKRPMFTLKEAFSYLGASVVGKNGVVPEEFAVFKANTSGTPPTGTLLNRFDGTGYPDQKVIAARRKVIDEYVAQLKGSTGFRG